MIYLKQVKLLDPDLVAGNPEELKYPYKAPAVRFTESFIYALFLYVSYFNYCFIRNSVRCFFNPVIIAKC